MEEVKERGFFSTIIKGVLISVLITLIAVFIFGFVIKLATLSGGAIKVVNQFIKALSLLIGVFVSVRGSKGLLKGGIIGVLTFGIVYLIFALLTGAVKFDTSFLIDLIFGAVIGILSGIIAVNIKKY